MKKILLVTLLLLMSSLHSMEDGEAAQTPMKEFRKAMQKMFSVQRQLDDLDNKIFKLSNDVEVMDWIVFTKTNNYDTQKLLDLIQAKLDLIHLMDLRDAFSEREKQIADEIVKAKVLLKANGTVFNIASKSDSR